MSSGKSRCTEKIVPIPQKLAYGGPVISRGFHNCIMFAQEILLRFKTPRVLIVGFLTGYDLVYLLKCGVEVYGLELTIPDVKLIKENSVKASGTDMPFKNKCFDWVVCTEVFEHLPMNVCEQILSEFRRVANNYYLTIATRDDAPWNTHINIHDGEWWIKALREREFEIAHAEICQEVRIQIKCKGGIALFPSHYPDGVLIYGSC